MPGNSLAALQGEPAAVRVGQVTVVTWPGQGSLGVELARRAGRPTEWPGLGLRTPGPLRLIVVPNARQLDSLSGGRAPEWGAGVALPGARTILLRADRDDLYGTLRHELAHLALHQAVKGRVPLWFDEGYASWAAGEWDRLGVLDLNLAVVRGAVPDLRALDGALRGSASTADAAYALAVSAVTELARRNPSRSLTPLLQRLEAGEDFDAAVLATTGLTIPQFDTQWRRTIRRRYSLATWLLAGGGWGILAFSMWALVRIRRKADLPRRAALDEGWELPPETTDTPELDRTQEP
ncbi:MAG: peptidase MA family metallohydrolase [Gemmatimonadales bacterium]